MKSIRESKVVIIGLGFLMEYITPCFKNALGESMKTNIVGVTADEKDLEGKRTRLGYTVLLNDNKKALEDVKPDIIFFAPPPTIAKDLTESVLKPYYESCRKEGRQIPTLFAFPPSPAGKYYMDEIGDDLQVINIIPNMMSKAGNESIANERCSLITYPKEGKWSDEDKKHVEDFFSPFGTCLDCTPDNILYVLSTEIATHPLTELCDIAARKLNEKGVDCTYVDVASFLRAKHQELHSYTAKNSNNCSLDAIKDEDAKRILEDILVSWYEGLCSYISNNGLTQKEAKEFLDPLFDIYFHITQVTGREEIVAKAKKDATKGGMLELCLDSYYGIVEPLIAKIFDDNGENKADIDRIGYLFDNIIDAVVERGKGLTKNKEIVFSPKQHSIMFGLIAKEILENLEDSDRILYEAVADYGRQRGSRMAQRCKADGNPLDMVGYFAYSEWKWDEGFRKSNIQFTPYFAHYVHECPWCTAWKESGLEDYGRYYCRCVDENICKGFNPELNLDMRSFLSGKEYDACEFHWVDACMDEEFSNRQKKIMEKIGSSCIRSFEYHTAHTYVTMMKHVSACDEAKAAEIDNRVRKQFAEKTSYLELMMVLKECNHDFEVAD